MAKNLLNLKLQYAGEADFGVLSLDVNVNHESQMIKKIETAARRPPSSVEDT